MSAGPHGQRRVAVLVKRFPRLSETFILNEFVELRRQGTEVELFAIKDPMERRSQPEALALKPEVTYLHSQGILQLLPRAARAFRRHTRRALHMAGWVLTRRDRRAAVRNYLHALVLISHLEEGGFNHLHAHFLHTPAAIAYIVNRISGVPYSVMGHAKDIYTSQPDDVQLRGRSALFVATCTEAGRQHLIRECGLDSSRVLLCRHGVDLQRFGVLPRLPRRGIILSIGRLVPKKGFDVLLQACALVVDRGLAVELRVIGGGPLRERLKAQAARLAIERHVRFSGERPQVDLLTQLSSAEIFVLTPVIQADGDRDGVPNVILEAMAAGLPVVSSAISGIPEVVHHGSTGLLVPPADPHALADALALLLTDPDLRCTLGQAARDFALENLSLEAAVAPLAERLGAPSRITVQARPA
jgi:glycosyltransferase involved in cell wall biosynthesis